MRFFSMDEFDRWGREKRRREEREERILVKEARREARREEARSDLFFAVLLGHLEEVKSFVGSSRMKDDLLNDVDYEHQTILHVAAAHNNPAIIKWILSDSGGRAEGFNLVLAKTKDGKTALHIAAKRGHLEAFVAVVEGCKVENGERFEMLNSVTGRTVLLEAAMGGAEDIMKWLLSEKGREAGFDPDNLFALNCNKQSVLHMAIEGKSEKCFDFAVSHCNNSAERLRLFLGRDDKGWTILHCAARACGDQFISHILLNYPEESKMIINARDHRGMTALHRAIIGGIDEESRGEWIYMLRDQTMRAVVTALLGFQETGRDSEEGRRLAERDVAAAANSGDEERSVKKPIQAKKVTIIAAGADPNVGLKFE